jgi:LGFP repeat
MDTTRRVRGMRTARRLRTALAAAVTYNLTCPAGQTCTPPVVWNNGPVQHDPRVYLIFWGPLWDTDTSGTKAALQTLFNGLAGTAVNNILSVYHDSTTDPNAYVHNDVKLAGTWADDSAADAPTTVELPNGASEVTRALAANPSWTNDANTQFTLVLQQGAGIKIGSQCGEHDYTDNEVIGFVNYPVVYTPPQNPPPGGTCSNSSLSDAENQMERTALHEYAEAATDPQTNTTGLPGQNWGWTTHEAGFPVSDPDQEIGDLCFGIDGYYSYGPSPVDTFARPSANLENIYVQDLWDVTANGGSGDCAARRGEDGLTPAGVPIHTVAPPMQAAYDAAKGTDANGLPALPPAGYPAGEQFPLDGGWQQDFSDGSMFATPAGQATMLYGPISTDYTSFYEPGSAHPIGWPDTGISPVGSCGCGQEARFDNGARPRKASCTTSSAAGWSPSMTTARRTRPRACAWYSAVTSRAASVVTRRGGVSVRGSTYLQMLGWPQGCLRGRS